MFAYALASKSCSEATNMLYLSSNGLTLAGFGESNQRKEDLKRKWRETDGFRLFSQTNYCYFANPKSFKSSSTLPIPAIPKLSTNTFATFGDKNAGSVGPRWIFFTPR